MSMKEELETWVTALSLYDAHEFEEAIVAFEPIADTSKILFNCGVIRATLGEHEAATHYYDRATALDQYLAVAYFQKGVSNFLVGNFEEALANFNDTLLYLRGNRYIDYEQLGLKYKLHSCEALFNRGLCYIYLQEVEAGLGDLTFAAKEKATPEHDVIDEAIKEKAEGYTVFSIPIGLVFRPNEAKVKNVHARDYLGKARLVAQAAENNASHRRKISAETWARDDRPPGSISYAATNLIRSNLPSRARQQSEPPVNRNYFPPTPPPEEKTTPRAHRRISPDRNGATGRSQSANRRPEPLNLGAAAFDRTANGTSQYQQQQYQQQQPRPKPARSASERPSERRPYSDRRSQDSDRYRSTHERLFGAMDSEGQQAEVAELLEQARNSLSQSGNHPRSARQQRQDLIQEEDEGHESHSARSPADGAIPEVREDTNNRVSYGRAGYRGSRRPQSMSKIRIKVHFGDDTRYIIVTPELQLPTLLEQVSKKFALAGGLKIKTRDEEGDMITVGDQDDLDMAVMMCKEAAIKEGSEMGKLEAV